MEVQFDFREQHRLLYNLGNEAQLSHISESYAYAMREFEAYLYIRAPYNLREDGKKDPSKAAMRRKATAHLNDLYFKRIADGSMRRSLCQYPTQANAQEAGMSLSQYEDFIYKACKLDQPDPSAAWKQLGAKQQKVVDYLNKVKKLRFTNDNMDISFSVAGRIWINSEGKSNMPSGEVFSSPVEDTVEGIAYFDYPSIYAGRSVEGITLEVSNGVVQKWDAKVGKEVLDEVFEVEGARQFGEVAIGTNYDIQIPTRNILFDEKIGGSIHMAVGQSYGQTGGKNSSAIHWDMIADMKQSGRIFADDVCIYEKGAFLKGLW